MEIPTKNPPTLYLIKILCVIVEGLVCCRSQSQKCRNRFGAHRETEINVEILVTKCINSASERSLCLPPRSSNMLRSWFTPG